MNFETALRCLDRLEHLQRTTSDLLLSTSVSPVCLPVVMTSRARCRVPLRKHSPYIGPTRSGDIQTLAIALQQLLEYGISVDLHMAASVSRHKISHLKLLTRKLEDLHA